MPRQRIFKGIPLTEDQIQLARNIDMLDDLTEQLRNLQAAWNNLGLLGELTNIGADISQTREHFHKLACSLSQELIQQSIVKVSLDLSTKAQNSIDILVRNLFERTADIGFLSIDTELARYSKSFDDNDKELIHKIRTRMQDYVAKYSVYDNILLLNSDGQLQVDLQGAYKPFQDFSRLKDKINQSSAYMELFDCVDAAVDKHPSLLYGWKIEENENAGPIGYVILKFNLKQESEALFDKILPSSDTANWIVCGVLDDENRVVFSSDDSSISPGHKLNLSSEKSWTTTRIGPISYLACIRDTQGYQGYMGPGWKGFSVVPLTEAFSSEIQEDNHAGNHLKVNWALTEGILNPSIMGIQTQAMTIQKQLNRSVWNGNISQREAKQNLGGSFTKTLLWEISKAGEQTRNLFATFIAELLDTLSACLRDEQKFAAMLAIDLMDRNLYERANDCRWWALTEVYEKALMPGATDEDIAKAKATLQHTNSLYTVYSDILLINSEGVVIANSSDQNWAGTQITAPWLKEALNLRNQNEYAVSQHEPSPLYNGKPTYIYCAAIHDNRHNPTSTKGAIAVVFDGEPQFEAILHESKSGNRQCHAYIVDERNNVISSNTDVFIEDGKLQLPVNDQSSEFNRQEFHSRLIEKDGIIFAMGTCNSGNYREYKAIDTRYQNNLTAVYLTRLGPTLVVNNKDEQRRYISTNKRDEREACAEIATFKIGKTWFGIEAENVDGAVEMRNLARIPNSPSWSLGTMLLGDESISVISLHNQLGEAREEIRPNGEYQVILLQTRTPGLRIGLHVDDLGEIPNIPMSQLHDTREITSEKGLVGTIAKSNDILLSILNHDHILNMVCTAENEV